MQKILFIMQISLIAIGFQSIAQGNLLITPNRVVFDGNKQREELSLVNMGMDTTTYSVSFVQKNMREDGSFVNIEKPDSGQMFADPYLRIFPRQITLAPGEPQSIMLQCRRTVDMTAGEYRSHLFFRSEKDYMPLGKNKTVKDTLKLSVQLIPVFGVSIPIIIRIGTIEASAVLSDLKIGLNPSTTPTIQFAINRKGKNSLYGDIIVQYISDLGKSIQIGKVSGLGVYTNISQRNVVVKLRNTTGKILKNGKLKVQYISSGDTKQVVYAEGELEIANNEIEMMQTPATN